jgi:hypothetical protein
MGRRAFLMRLPCCLWIFVAYVTASLMVTPNPRKRERPASLPESITFYPFVSPTGEIEEYRAEINLFNCHERSLLAYRVLSNSRLIKISDDDPKLGSSARLIGTILYGKPAGIISKSRPTVSPSNPSCSEVCGRSRQGGNIPDKDNYFWESSTEAKFKGLI